MRWLFAILICALIASDIAGRTIGLGPGLSIKNALLYAIALALFFRLALQGRLRIRLPAIQVGFAIWITYALLTWIAAAVVIHYRGYDAIRSAITLKSYLIDSVLFFLTAFYGVQNEEDFKTVMKVLLGAFVVSSLVTITDVVGLTHLGTKIGDSGAEADRVFGAFGNANETGALIVYLTPAVVALAMLNTGVRRVLWYAGAAACFAVLILTVSRGAFVGLVVGYGIAFLICKRYLPASRVAGAVLVTTVVVLFAVALVSMFQPRVEGVVIERLFGASTSVDMGEASSGRNVIWARAIQEMMSAPITLFTGFGWDVYSVMPFVYVTHNQYLDEWFNLGLPGLLSFLFILGYAVLTARRAVDLAGPQMRGYMIAFVFGMLAFAVSIFFCNIYVTRPYVWLYVGLSMRAAVFVFDDAERRAVQRRREERPRVRAPVPIWSRPA
jgi:O-antigen ligase